MVRNYVWDKGLIGWSNSDLGEELCEELGVGKGDLVRIGQIKVSHSKLSPGCSARGQHTRI